MLLYIVNLECYCSCKILPTIGNNAKNATTTTVERKPEINPVTTGPRSSTKHLKKNHFKGKEIQNRKWSRS